VTAPGSHTLVFWSVDTAGNIEARKSATFTITVPAPLPVPDPTVGGTTVKTRISGRDTFGATATLTNRVTGDQFTAVVGYRGVVVFNNVTPGTYRLSVATESGSEYIKRIRVRNSDDDRVRVSYDSRRSHRHLED